MRRVSMGRMAGLAAAVCLVVLVAILPNNGVGQIDSRIDRIAAALEAYAVDNNGAYPTAWNTGSQTYLPRALTTPIAYLQGADMIDPFALAQEVTPFLRYINVETDIKLSQNPAVQSSYPHLKARHGSWIIWSGTSPVTNPESGITYDRYRYDPTNGTQARNDPSFPMVYSFRSQRMILENGRE